MAGRQASPHPGLPQTSCPSLYYVALVRVGGACGALAVLVAATTGGCALPGASQSPGRVLSDSLRAFTSAHSVNIKGTVTQDTTKYIVNLSTDDHSNVDAYIVIDGAGINVRQVAGKLFFTSAAYFQSQGAMTGGRWVLAPHDNLALLVGKLANRPELASALLAAAGDVKQEEGPSMDGRKTIKLTGAGMTVLVSGQGSGRPLQITTGPGHLLSNKLSDVHFDLSAYDQPVNVQAPTAFADLSDPNTLPVRVTVTNDSFSFDSCDRSGCTLSAVVRNDGGKDGTATVNFHIKRSGQEIGSCQVAVPVLGNRETRKVGCRINYAETGTVTGTVSVSNPVV